MGENGRTPLTAIDLLGLTKLRKVGRIDLSELGYEGVIYVRDLTAAENSRITSGRGKGGNVRYYKDESYEVAMAALMESAGPQFLMAAVVTDVEDGRLLERAFDADPDAEYVTVKEPDLVQMSDQWIREAGNRAKAEAMLEQMPNIITNAVVKLTRRLSGAGEEREEKKDDS